MSGQTRNASGGNMLIEPAEFARRGDVRSGSIAAGRLPRLAQAVLDLDAPIKWEARGEVADVSPVIAPKGTGWFMDLAVSALLKLRCQRCLDAFEMPVSVNARVLMLPESLPLPDEELEVEDFDAISVGMELSLADLIEDELLLSLPVAPRHVQCALPGPGENGEKQSPFAILSQLKRGH